MTDAKVPIYEVVLTASDLDIEVRVNDVPVMRVGGGHVETKFDVNPHVFTGKNHLGAVVRPPGDAPNYSPGARAEIELRVLGFPGNDLVDPRGRLVFEASGVEAGEAFAHSWTPEGAEPVVRQARAGLAFRSRIPVDLMTPFPPWGWLSADTLNDGPVVFDELHTELEALWSLVQSKDTATLEAVAAEQAIDWQIAYGLDSEDEAQRLLGVADTLGDPDVEALPLPDPGDLRLQLLGFRKLARLVDADGKDPITLGVRNAPHMTGRFTAMFCRRDGSWVMIR
ncbi:MAG: hypothetical protein AAF799_21995 [Myxococcota bacterium]